MFETEAVIALLKAHGLGLLAPLAVIEGPIVTILAAGFAGVIGAKLWQITLIVIAGDLIGDLMFYGIGRIGPKILPRRFHARFEGPRTAALTDQFVNRGGRILLLGKLTHSLGAVVLVAAGAARMNVFAFFGWNLLGTIPKSIALVALGYWVGQTYAKADVWLLRAGIMSAALGLVVLVLWLWKRKAPCPT
jgi:membrane protein DedA with SNARE-associated domain